MVQNGRLDYACKLWHYGAPKKSNSARTQTDNGHAPIPEMDSTQ